MRIPSSDASALAAASTAGMALSPLVIVPITVNSTVESTVQINYVAKTHEILRRLRIRSRTSVATRLWLASARSNSEAARTTTLMSIPA
ncbi:MAG: hypothetical protein FWD57_11130, partial [Polyangiaceae bacterium]|nr:hypothetical protein [Polyangiaceae bacterium]